MIECKGGDAHLAGQLSELLAEYSCISAAFLQCAHDNDCKMSPTEMLDKLVEALGIAARFFAKSNDMTGIFEGHMEETIKTEGEKYGRRKEGAD